MTYGSRTADMPTKAPEKPAQGFLFGLNSHLGRIFMGAPFTNQGEAAVCARVALALIRLERRRRAPDEPQPLILIGCTVERLKGLQLPTVRLALLSVAVWVGEKHRTDDWLAGVLMRDYYGLPIRRCYYAEYKANRRR